MLEPSGYRDRHNIRPLVFGACFICGMILGFVSYLASPSFAQTQKVQDEKDEETERQKEQEAQKKVKPVPTAPAFTAVDKNLPAPTELALPPKPATDIEDERDTAKGDLRAIPEAQPVAMGYDIGLTGRTTYRPLPPVKVEKPAPAVDFKRPAVGPGGKPVDINNVALPEIED